MKKLKLFIENFIIYGLGGILNKLIPLLMLPVITRLMPDSGYFGISDLANTVVSLASALAVMGIYDAMYRMFFEKEDILFKKRICSTALCFTILTSVIVFVLLLVFKDIISHVFFGSREFAYLLNICAMTTLVSAANQIIAAPTRMQNKRRIYVLTNLISSFLSYLTAIMLMRKGYYIIALPLATLISGFTIEAAFIIINRSWFSIRLFDGKLLKNMLAIAVPLLPSFILYWVFNSSDKIMITNMIGVEAAGIYSVGSKLGHASQLIYTAFAGGWQYFAYSTMKEENQVKSNSAVFEYLGILSFTATFFVCSWSCLIYKVMFAGDYRKGYIIAPYLFLAPLLQMLFQVACSQFIIIKKTWPNMLILSGGAVLNIVMNMILIPVIGIEGASIATMTGYIVSVTVCVIVLHKMRLMIFTGKFMISVVIMIIYIVTWRIYFCDKTLIGTFTALMATVILMLLYKNDLNKLINILKGKNVNI